MNEPDVVRALGALAQETRLKLFRLLVVAGQGGLTPGHMAERLAVSPTALSFHLKELSHAGLVSAERDGRNLIYRAVFERMNELQVAIGRKGQHLGYQRVMVAPGFGEFGAFQPGAGTGMGYDDLKVIEAKKFLLSYLGKESKNSNIHDAVAAARVNDAVEESMKTKQWISIKPSANTTAAIRK